MPRAAPCKPHASPGRLWCPGISGIHYADRGGYLRHVTSPDDVQAGSTDEKAPGDKRQVPPDAREGSAARRLAEIARLHADGLLTDQEYREKRREIIGQL